VFASLFSPAFSPCVGVSVSSLPLESTGGASGFGEILIPSSTRLINMFELSLITNVNELRKYYMAVHSSSLALKRIHDRHEGIILGDASYDNIIVIFHPFGMIEKTLCIDFDSVQISSVDCEFKVTSKLLANFYSDLGIKKYEHSQNTDRLTRLLYFLRTFFALDLFELPLYEYDKKCELSNTLKNLRNTIIELKKLMDDKKLPYIPYMHEVLDLTDAFGLSSF